MSEDDEQPRQVLNTSVPHLARVYDYWLGGKTNYAVDRELAERIISAQPDMRRRVQENRGFLARAVHYLAAEQGIRQFLDIGTGIPAANNTHEVAQKVAPDSRIVYVDNDPIVLVHAQALLTSDREGACDYIEADIHDPEKILTAASNTLDLSKPTALMLVAILHCVPEDHDPYGIVERLTAAMAPGSYLVFSHPASDVPGTLSDLASARHEENASIAETGMPTLTFRSLPQIQRLLDGWDLLEPGIVPTSQWRPKAGTDPAPVPVWAAVARKG